MSIQLRDGFVDEPIERVMEDLLVRFVVNCPDEDLSSVERVYFQVEEAHWFYLDFVRNINPILPSMKMKAFSDLMFTTCPDFWKWGGSPSDALAKFTKYKSTIPVRGVAILNKDLTKILLVQGTESKSWGFPRGKISKDETDVECAVREVREEIGFDCSEYIDENAFVERTVKGKSHKIFLVYGIDEGTDFQPMVRNEIAKIEWIQVSKIEKSSNKFFLVGAMIKPIKQFISRVKGTQNDEEVRKQATVLLKLMLGVGAKPKETIDPGRELLNVLQKVSKERSDGISDDLKPQNVPVPPQFTVPYQFMPMPYYGQPPWQMPQMPYGHPAYAQHVNAPFMAPNPQLFQKPTFDNILKSRSKEANSSQLLGILKKPASTVNPPKNELLDMLKRPNSSLSKSDSQHFSLDTERGSTPGQNVLEILKNPASVVESGNSTPEKKLLNMLKRPTVAADVDPKVSVMKKTAKPDRKPRESTPEMELLNMIKKNVASKNKASQSTESEDDLLGILKRRVASPAGEQSKTENDLFSRRQRTASPPSNDMKFENSVKLQTPEPNPLLHMLKNPTQSPGFTKEDKFQDTAKHNNKVLDMFLNNMGENPKSEKKKMTILRRPKADELPSSPKDDISTNTKSVTGSLPEKLSNDNLAKCYSSRENSLKDNLTHNRVAEAQSIGENENKNIQQNQDFQISKEFQPLQNHLSNTESMELTPSQSNHKFSEAVQFENFEDLHQDDEEGLHYDDHLDEISNSSDEIPEKPQTEKKMILKKENGQHSASNELLGLLKNPNVI